MPVVILHKATMTECMKFKYNDCERECHVNLGDFKDFFAFILFQGDCTVYIFNDLKKQELDALQFSQGQ